MDNATRHKIRDLARLTVGQLQERYGEVFGGTSRSNNRLHLIRRLAWRIQAEAEGGLSDRALRRAREVADEHGLRLSAPRDGDSAQASGRAKRDRRLAPGSVLVRPYKGRTLEVRVLEEGFLFEGETYASLTAVARKVTGSNWSGHVFFGLVRRKRGR